MKKIIIGIILFLIGSGLVFATNNFIKKGYNWDANIDTNLSANDIFTLSGRLDIEDSESEKYLNENYRGKISGIINSELFGDFDIVGGKIDLINDNSKENCTESTETFSLSGSLNSYYWGQMNIDSSSYMCPNGYFVLILKSPVLGYKNIGDSSQSIFGNVFQKQQISVLGIGNLKGNLNILSNLKDDGLLNLKVEKNSKTLAIKNINKNIFYIMSKYYNSNYNLANNLSSDYKINSIDFKNNNDENYYLFKYFGNSQDINFSKGIGGKYLNKGDILEIGDNSNNHIKISGKQNIIVEGGNVYIKANTYNENNKSLLIIIAKKDKNGNGGNIYIDTDITNIDAILIADGSLISYDGDTKTIQEVDLYKNNLRKQLLIYGSVFSSNNVGTDSIPYGADYYKKISDNKLENSIYDLGNLRKFNVNYGTGSTCGDETKLAPIDGNGDYIKYAWVGKKECYISDSGDSLLRKSNKMNPLIIEYNPMITILKPYLLNKN